MWKRILFVIFILFSIELGLFLLLLPWSELWSRNAFLLWFPELRPLLLSNYVRGALSGLGVVNLWVGVSDAWNFRENMVLMERQEKRKTEAGPLDAGAATLPSSRGRNA